MHNNEVNEKIKLLFIIDSSVWGGAEIYILRLAKTLLEMNNLYEISLIVPVNSEVGQYFRSNNIDVFEIGLPLFRDFESLKSLYKTIKKISPDIVQINMPSPYSCFFGGAALIAKFAGVKKVVVSECLASYKDKFPRPQLKRFFNIFADHFIALTKTNGYQMNQLHHIPMNKIYYSGFGIELPEVVIKDAKVNSSHTVIGIVGRLEEQKRQDLFLKVAKNIRQKNKSVEFWIIGKGILRESLERESIALGLSDYVKFIGFLEKREDIFSKIDILLVTSLLDPMPVVIIEAMSYRKPVVAFDIDSIHEAIIDNENGFLVPPGDLGFMTDRALDLINNPDKSAKFGKKGYEFFMSKFLLENMVEKTHQLYVN